MHAYAYGHTETQEIQSQAGDILVHSKRKADGKKIKEQKRRSVSIGSSKSVLSGLFLPECLKCNYNCEI